MLIYIACKYVFAFVAAERFLYRVCIFDKQAINFKYCTYQGSATLNAPFVTVSVSAVKLNVPVKSG
jgi:hypothetical protein